MEKEKKKISCSYVVLVIILFAALAFVTDYAFIERKTSKCDCPKCEATNNEEKEESEVIDTDMNVVESNHGNNTQNDSTISGIRGTNYFQKYLQYISYNNNGEEVRTFEIILNLDGTAEWNIVGNDSDSSNLVGFYHFISSDKIVLALFEKEYLTSQQCNNELTGSCQTSLILDYDSSSNIYKANNITYKEVQKNDLKSLSN